MLQFPRWHKRLHLINYTYFRAWSKPTYLQYFLGGSGSKLFNYFYALMTRPMHFGILKGQRNFACTMMYVEGSKGLGKVFLDCKCFLSHKCCGKMSFLLFFLSCVLSLSLKLSWYFGVVSYSLSDLGSFYASVPSLHRLCLLTTLRIYIAMIASQL